VKTPTTQEVGIFREAVAKRMGLQFDDTRLDMLTGVLGRRLEAWPGDAAAYFQCLDSGGSRQEIGKLAEDLTVTETYFFRNENHFRALTGIVLPERIRARGSQRKLRMMSAGCASGDEPYSLAMAIRHQFPELAGWDVRIQAVDVNPAMLAKAAAGRYSGWALREIPAWARDRYFQARNGEFQLAEEIRSMVDFQERNLIEPHPDLWEKDAFDLIFVRNMLMYFAPDTAAALVARMAGALAPNGYLFLGHAETLRGLSHAFHLCHSHETFYYRRMDSIPTRTPDYPRWQAPPPPASLPPPWDPSTTWMEAIQKASEKIAGLAERSREAVIPEDGGVSRPLAAPVVDLGAALEFLRQERFGEALQVLESLPSEWTRDFDARLLSAVLLTNMGRREEAEAVCRQLLLADELNGGPHYLMALCREQAGDAKLAEECDRTAIYLDSAFAMPWLHLGLLAKRAGRVAEARRHLEQALVLLAKEDTARILLFGGGFAREALAQLCRSEIKTLGGEE